MPALLIATLDTKGVEARFVRDRIRSAGVDCLVVDVGVLAPPAIAPDVSREQVFAAAATSAEAVRTANDRGQAVEAAARGVAALVRQLRPDGVIGLGGSAGTTIATAAMRELPVGVPKVMVSTLASGQVRPYVGVRDVCMMYSVVDISGLNRISRRVLANAADALIGMLRGGPLPEAEDRPLITATMFGVTTPCVEAGRAVLEKAGYEVLVFHATGTGGQTMEGLIRDGAIQGVLDVTTTELADELVGGILSAGRDRLTAASLRGVPQVIGLGALDMVNFGPPETVPERFKGRRFYQHNPSVTLMRTTPEENDTLGKEIAHKASASRGPVAVYVPLRGVSALDREGAAFWWPEADRALFDSLRLWMAPQVKLVELDLHINDPAFADAMAAGLLEMLRRSPCRCPCVRVTPTIPTMATLNVVTGATGLLGSHVVEHLRDRGDCVRALVRPSSDTTWLRERGVELIVGDLEDPKALLAAVDGADVVYHCAARVGDWGPWPLFQRAVVEATGNLLVACQTAGVGRLLHVSSINVYGHLPPGEGLLTEDEPLGQNLWWWDHYCRAKIEAEGLVRACPVPWTIVRPSWMYGPRDRNSFPRVVRAIETGQARIVGDGTNRLNIVYAADVADGVLRAATTPAAVGRAYNLSSRGDVTQRDFLDAITDALGAPRVTRCVPYGLAFTGGFLMEALGRTLGWSRPPALTRYAVALIGRSTRFSIERARQELDWVPTVHPMDGLRRTLEWFRPAAAVRAGA